MAAAEPGGPLEETVLESVLSKVRAKLTASFGAVAFYDAGYVGAAATKALFIGVVILVTASLFVDLTITYGIWGAIMEKEIARFDPGALPVLDGRTWGLPDYVGNHLTLVANAVQVPVIRTDYIFSEYQVVETRAAGADGLILTPGIMKPEIIRRLISATQRNLMTVIAKVHNERELHMVLPFEPRIIAIDNSPAMIKRCGEILAEQDGIGGQRTIAKRRHQCRRVHQTTPRRVDQDGVVTHQAKRIGGHHSTRGIVQRAV